MRLIFEFQIKDEIKKNSNRMEENINRLKAELEKIPVRKEKESQEI